jgi:hypothetical protein
LPVTFSVLSGPATLSSNVLTLTGVGVVSVRASQPGNLSYTAAPDVVRSLTVNQASLVVMGANKSRTYGATNPTLTGTLTGVINSDNITASYSTTADTNSPVGGYAIIPALNDPGSKLANYSVTTNNGALSVTPASLTGTASNKSRLYGQVNPAFSVTYTGFVNGEDSSIVTGTLIGSTGANTNSPVGTYPISISGQSAPNYTINYVDGTLSILPAALLVQADNKSRAYGQANPAFTATVSGFVNGENSIVLGGALAFNTTAETNSPVGTYTIEVSGLLSTNYSITFSNGTLTITPFALTVTADSHSRAYGALNPTLTGTLTGVQNGDNITASYSITADTNSPVGTYSIIPALNDPGSKLINYSVTTNSGTLTVTQALLTLTADNQSRTYGAANPTLTGTLTSVGNGDNITASYSTTADTNSPVGDYSIIATLNDPDTKLGNYLVTTNNGTLSVTPASLTGTAENKSRLYGQLNPEFTATYSGFVNAEDSSTVTGALIGSTTADTNSPVGAYPISVSGQSAPNYTISYVDGTLSVLPAAVLVQADDKSRAYGQANPVFTATVSGFVNGEDSSVLGGAPVFKTLADTNSPVGTYPIEVSGLLSTNYSIIFSNGTLTVTPFALTVTADNQSRAYGARNPILTGTVAGVQNGHNITASYSTIVDTNSAVGDYLIVPALNDPEGRLVNYSVTTNNGTLTVTQALLSVSADNQSRTYGAANPALTGTLIGVVNGDNFTASYSTTPDTNSAVGDYPIVPALNDPDSKLANYSVTTNNGTLSVTPASLTGTADNKSRLYGQLNPAFTVTYTGFVNGEDSSIVTGTLIGSTTADTNSPVGGYPISVSGQSAPNYTITYADGTLNVLPVALLVQADDKSRAYGQTDPAFTASVSGFVNGEDSSVLGGALSFSTTADTNSPVGSYSIEVTGLLSTNYSITFSNGTLTLTPFALTVTADNHSRAYGAANPTLTGTLAGVQNGDNITATYSTIADTNSPVETYSIVPELHDPDGKLVNYSITTTNGTLTVTQALLSVTADNQSRTYGAANSTLAGTVTGVVNGDNITVSYSTTADTNSPVGSYSIVASLNDPDGKQVNYNVTTSDGTLTVTQALLTVTAVDQSKVFSEPNSELSVNYSGFVNGENSSVLDGAPLVETPVTPSSPAGQYPITASAGTLSANNYSFQFVAGTFTVEAAATSTSLGSSQNPSTEGATVTFTATVSAVAPANEGPSGDVQFLTNGVPIGDPVPLVSGVATLSTSLLPPGSNVVQAVYGGNSNFNPSTNALVQVVNPEAQQPSTLAIHDNGNATVTVFFSGTAGAQYIVQVADSIGGPGTWSNVSTNTAAADGIWTYTESTAGHANRFFRSGKITAP